MARILAGIVVGGLLATIGLILFLRPQWVDWLNDQTNLRAAKWWARYPGYEWTLEKYERQKGLFRKLVPVWLVIIGLGWIAWGIT